MSGSEALSNPGDRPLWKRVLSTPVFDLIRGRVGADSTVRVAVARANLPAAVARLIEDVVRRTRLWRGERADVARELITHFQDGIEAGATPDDLVRRFGDPQQAAELIRRARIRCRNRVWHAWRWALRGAAALFAVLCLVHVVLTVRYLTGKSVISRDYVAEWTAESEKIAESDRAWPLVRKAFLSYHKPAPLANRWSDSSLELPDDDPDWPRLVEHVQINQQSLALMRQASALPGLGLRFNDAQDDEFRTHFYGRKAPTAESPGMLLTMPVPQLNAIYQMVLLVCADLRVSLKEHDAHAVRQDLKALLGICRRPAEPPILAAEMYQKATFELALKAASDVLEKSPHLLSEADWIGLAHEIATYHGGGTLRFHSHGEQDSFEDFLQRTFTDDGHGDGRLTPEGAEIIVDTSEAFSSQVVAIMRSPPWLFQAASKYAVGPAVMAFTAGRREQRELAARLRERSESENTGPFYTWKVSASESELMSLHSNDDLRLRYAPVVLYFPAMQYLASYGEQITQLRDGVLTAIALELYHRSEGKWPDTLDALVPRYLPNLPLDRFTGKTLSYKLRNDKPLIYACGGDAQDDGGRASMEKRADRRYGDTIGGSAKSLKPGEGYDWVLFPRLRFPPEPIEPEAVQP